MLAPPANAASASFPAMATVTRSVRLTDEQLPLSRVPPAPSHDGEGDQENHDSGDANDVRHNGDETGNVARVRPDEANNRPYDEYGDHHA